MDPNHNFDLGLYLTFHFHVDSDFNCGTHNTVAIKTCSKDEHVRTDKNPAWPDMPPGPQLSCQNRPNIAVQSLLPLSCHHSLCHHCLLVVTQ